MFRPLSSKDLQGLASDLANPKAVLSQSIKDLLPLAVTTDFAKRVDRTSQPKLA